ncbi:MAG: phosphatase PAP2 family protein [Polyangiales bacterium]
MRALLAALSLCGMGIAVPIISDSGPHFGEASVLLGLELARTEGATSLVIALTNLGGHYVMIPVCVVLVAFFTWRDRREGAFLAIAWASSALVNELFKVLVSRPRPSIVDALTSPRGLSFPSGHSQASMALVLGLILVLYRSDVPLRRTLWLLLFPFAIGITRAYLGVHYPTDILAGWCLGAALVLVTHRLFPPQVSAESTI